MVDLAPYLLTASGEEYRLSREYLTAQEICCSVHKASNLFPKVKGQKNDGRN